MTKILKDTIIIRVGMLSFLLTMCLYGFDVAPMFPVNLKGPIHSSPIVADIDGDNLNEVLVGSDSDTLYCLDHDGYIEWKFGTGGDIISSPALGDIDNDGYLDIVFQSEDGYLYVLDNQGDPLLNWPQPLEDIPYNARYNSTPALADIDGDSELEIVTLSPKYCPDHNPPYNTTQVYAFNADGSILWTWERDWPGAGAWNGVTSPSIADVDRDGILDVVVYFGIIYYSPNGPGVGLYALRGTDGHNFYERRTSIASTRSSPSIADINGDGKLDAVVSCFPPPYTNLSAITIEDDSVLWSLTSSYTIDNYSLASPTFGNINEDPFSEIVPGGRLVALDKDGNVLWNDGDIFSYNSSAVLGDINNDEKMEIIVATSTPKGLVYGFDGDGNMLGDFPLVTDTAYSIQSTPVLCDLDGDGFLDIVVGSTNGKLYEWDTDYEYNELGMLWPGFKNNIRRNGYYRPVVDITLSPSSIFSVPGDTINLNISVANNSYRSHSIQVSLDARLPSGIILPILENFPQNGYTIDEYSTVSGDITLAIPEGIPQLDVWLRGNVSGVSGYTTDRDSSLVHVLGDRGSSCEDELHGIEIISLPDFMTNSDTQSQNNVETRDQSGKNMGTINACPNPFTHSTEFGFQIMARNNVNLTIYNVLGQKVVTLLNRRLEAGNYNITWDGKDSSGSKVSKGIYFITMKADDFEATKKMLIVR